MPLDPTLHIGHTSFCLSIWISSIYSSRYNLFFDRHQHWFRKGHSLCSLGPDSTPCGQSSSIELSALTLSIYLDFFQAFNSGPHQRLLTKLDCMGVRGNSSDGLMHSSANISKEFSLRASPQTGRRYHQVSLRGLFLGPYSSLFTSMIVTLIWVHQSACLQMTACATFKVISSVKDCKELQLDLNQISISFITGHNYGSSPSTSINARSWG